MKRKYFYIFFISFILAVFIGCSNADDDSSDSSGNITYKVEAGVISNETYYSALNQIASITTPSYYAVSSVRLYLMNNTISNHEIQNNVSLEEIRSFMLSKGFSNYEASSEIEFLKTYGNNIAFFTHATDSSKKVWMYVTK